MEDLTQMDLYELIGTIAGASTAEIKTAYRKKALSCHPDKNPDKPEAAELFHRLSKALEILTDDSARAAYDNVLRARHRAKVRASKYDSKRKKFKEDLEAREEAHGETARNGSAVRSDERKLRAEIERLRREGSRQVEEEVALVRRRIYDGSYAAAGGAKNENRRINDTRVKIKWKAAPDDADNGGYDYDSLHRILSKHGDIVALVMLPTKKGSAVVEYEDRDSADIAVRIEMGLTKNPLKLQGLWPSKVRSEGSFAPFEPTGGTSAASAAAAAAAHPKFEDSRQRRSLDDAEFESSVLENMKRAEERKRARARARASAEADEGSS